MNVVTPFDAALAELLRAWRRRDDLRQQPNPDDAAVRAAFVELDRAREWVRRARTTAVWRFERRDDPRDWLPQPLANRVRDVTQRFHGLQSRGVEDLIASLIAQSHTASTRQCVGLDPATNVMNPRAQEALAAGFGTRAPTGFMGDMSAMGMEAVEQIEVIAASLASEVFAADFADVRSGSAAMAHRCAVMAVTTPGDTVVVCPGGMAGLADQRPWGVAGMYGLHVEQAPVGSDGISVDEDALRRMASVMRPRLITLGGTTGRRRLAAVRHLADEVGATVLVDARWTAGLIAGGAWPNPLVDGAHVMTLGTDASLAGPPGGMVLTRDASIARRVETVTHSPLMRDVLSGRMAALVITLLDWLEQGRPYAAAMVASAQTLADALVACGLPVLRHPEHRQVLHEFSLDASAFGDGWEAALHLRRANILACGAPMAGGGATDSSVRLGTSEIARWGMIGDALPQLASFIAQAWASEDPSHLARKVQRFRSDFRQVHYVR